jgi:transketolase
MPLEPLLDKWQAFNFAVLEINGHNMRQVLEALDIVKEIHDRPTVIVAHTTKGKGVSFHDQGEGCLLHGGPVRVARPGPRR